MPARRARARNKRGTSLGAESHSNNYAGFPGESKPAFKARIKREGKWGHYVQERADYCAQHGVGTAEAHRAIFPNYPQPEKDVHSEGRASGGSGEKVNQEDHSTRGRERALHNSSSPEGGLIDMARFCVDEKVSERQVVRWVFENVAVADVGPEAAPCSGAWGLLDWIRKSPAAKSDFYRNVWGPMLRGASTDEQAERFTDDGREQIDLIDAVIRASEDAAILPSSAERLASEPALSAQDD